MNNQVSCFGCERLISKRARECPGCGYPIAEHYEVAGRLLELRDDYGLAAIPQNAYLFKMDLNELHDWLGWARTQLIMCPRCTSPKVVRVKQPGFWHNFWKGATAGLVSEVTGVGVIVRADLPSNATHGCQSCGGVWEQSSSKRPQRERADRRQPDRIWVAGWGMHLDEIAPEERDAAMMYLSQTRG